ncbi:hypothetical protein WICMUC_003251 [Wickerhamomyces mucosus]|uniref:Uncharacterized protein n=1 Tax=Wickerhamomyces mucosus TaxID=1378264 RepID=A0A9P8PNG1_9ASCO|nr:hypothetical protein WICMUC_003251 [Wickerhamomyces mucosus]
MSEIYNSDNESIELIIQQLETQILNNDDNINTNNENIPNTKLLRSRSKDIQLLNSITKQQFIQLLSIFIKLNNLSNQFDLITTLSNILLINQELNQYNFEINQALRKIIPTLYGLLDLISERKITSESEYLEFLPIFRLYFLLINNYSKNFNDFISIELKSSIKKISSKLLNFVTMSSLKSKNLNLIIIEILKILYSFIHLSSSSSSSSLFHQSDSNYKYKVYHDDFLSGIDSSFVLSCNKFNLLYSKMINKLNNGLTPSRSSSTSSTHSNISVSSSTSSASSFSSASTSINDLNFETYDQVLFYFGNVILAIPIEISQNYMLNKTKFTENLIYYTNKLIKNDDGNEIEIINRITSNLLTIDILLTIDEEKELKKIVKNQLNFKEFDKFKIPIDSHLKIVISELNKKILSISSNELENTLLEISNENIKQEKFKPFTKEEEEKGLNEINEIFDKIEQNGILKISMS